MKNRKKILGLVLVVLAAALLLAACSGGGKIEGTWKVKSVSGSGNEYNQFKQFLDMGVEMTMTFKDGKITMSYSYMGQSDSTEMGTYKTSGDKLTLDGEEAKYKVDGNTLTIEDSYIKMTLEKK